MQVRTFEAETLTEALDAVKRELGPEAIILQTKTNKKGFGLLSRASVEITAAVSDREMSRKKQTETRLPENLRKSVEGWSAKGQADLIDRSVPKKGIELDHAVRSTKEKVHLSGKSKKEATRYIDIDTEKNPASSSVSNETYNRTNSKGFVTNSKSSVSGAIASSSVRASSSGGAKITDGSNIDSLDIRTAALIKNDMPAAPVPTRSVIDSQVLEKLRRDVRLLQDALQSRSQNFKTEGCDELFHFLIQQGFHRYSAYEWVKQVEVASGALDGLEDLKECLAELWLTKQKVLAKNWASVRSEGPRVSVFFGPPGCGKSTLIKKLTGFIRERDSRRKVGFIEISADDVGSLETPAKLFKIPYRRAKVISEVSSCVEDMSSLQEIFIEINPAMDSDDDFGLEIAKQLKSLDISSEFHLVLSLLSRDLESLRIAARASTFGLTSLCLSHVDSARQFAGLLELPARAKAPLSLLGVGRRIPADLEEASIERCVSLLLGF